MVAVHCKGVFQSGQISAAIGRAVSPAGLYLLNYRKGLCYSPKTVISMFYNTASVQYLTNFTCCINKPYICIKTDTEGLPDDSGSDFDLEELDFIEHSLTEYPQQIIETELPDYIDVNKLKTFNQFDNPVTDIQQKINELCEKCDHTRFTHFCKVECKRVNELLSDISPEKITTPKEWTSILSLNHNYITSEKYLLDLKKMFCVFELSQEHLQFASNIVLEILKLSVHNIAEKVNFNKE